MSRSGRSRHGGGGFPDNAPVGSIIYKDDDGRYKALIPGTATYVLKTNGAGLPPSWVVMSGGGGGMTNPMIDGGDTIYGDSDGTPLRRAIGFNGDIYQVVSGQPQWVDPDVVFAGGTDYATAMFYG